MIKLFGTTFYSFCPCLSGFSGDNVTVTPTGGVKKEVSLDYNHAADFLELEIKKKKKRKRDRYNTDDDFIVGDSAFDDGILGSGVAGFINKIFTYCNSFKYNSYLIYSNENKAYV